MSKMIWRLLCLVILLLPVLSLPVVAQDESPTVTLIPQTGLTFGLRLSPDDRTLVRWESSAVLADDPAPEYRLIRLIDVETGDVIAQLEGASDYTNDVAFTSDGAIMASIHLNGDVNLWDVAAGKLLKRIELLTLNLARARFLADDRTLIVMTGDAPALFLVLDTETGAVTRIFGQHVERRAEFLATLADDVFGRLDFLYTAFAVSGDGQFVAAATPNGDVLLWDQAEGTQPITLYDAPDEARGRFEIRALQLTDAGRSLVYHDAGRAAFIKVDLASREEIGMIPGGTLAFAVAPDGDHIAWLDGDRHSVLLSAFSTPDSVEQLVEYPEGWRVGFTGSPVSFSTDGSTLIAGAFGAVDGDNGIYVIELNG